MNTRRFMKTRWRGIERTALCMIAVSFPFSVSAFDVPPVPDPVCVYNCAAPYVPPQGPTAKELRDRKEAKDLHEAATDAVDKGDDAYGHGQFERAVELYKEALEYEPDDRDTQSKLDKAQEKARAAREQQNRLIRQSETVRQLTSADRHSNNAKATGDKLEAGNVFDTDGGRGPGIAVPARPRNESTLQRPVIPPSKRTPAITAMERQMDTYDREIQALNDKLNKLDPSRDAVEIAKVKQQKTSTEDKRKYVTFTINEALKTPDPLPSAK